MPVHLPLGTYGDHLETVLRFAISFAVDLIALLKFYHR